MKRSLGCLSVYGLIVSVILVAGVGIWTLLKGATLFSPGPLTAMREGSPLQGTASHAEVESRCTLCHRPWSSVDPARCLACHTAVDGQIAARTGLHGRLEDPEACTLCHPDHQGRQADIARAALDQFPHDQVGFTLIRHQRLESGAAFTCTDCHSPGYTLNLATCTTCHHQIDAVFMDQHVADYGAGCLSCHDGSTMPDDLNHDTFFPLDGAHAGIACAGCHGEEALSSLSGACVTCHEEPQLHRGGFGTDCAACHTAQGWRPARLQYHAFPLDHGRQGDVPCLSCHPDTYVAYTCYGCHEHQPDQVEREHRELDIAEIADCVRCHPTGRGEQE